MSAARAWLGLGANLGDRQANLAAALARLEQEPGIRVLRRSRWYESEPIGVTDQPWFLNGVVEIETTLPPRALLEALKRIEWELGRRPTRRWGERVIDLDILLYDDQRLETPDLVLPHPRLWQRLFVLAPLAELHPALRAPDGRLIEEVAAELSRTTTVRVWAPDQTSRLEGRHSAA